MADRYWVGGTASWDGTAGTKWATTSGGAGGASVPTTADDVFFDAASTGTVTIASGNTGAKSINCTGFTGTITGSANITVAGSVTLVAGMTYTHTGTVTVTGTGTITTAGKTFSALTVNGAGITVTLGDAINTGGRNISINVGTFDTANYSITCGSFHSASVSTRAINLGSSTVSAGGLNPVIDFGAFSTSGLTFNAGTSQINITGVDDQLQFRAGSNMTYNNVAFTGSGATLKYIFGGTGVVFNNLSINANATGVTTISSAIGFTVNGTLTCAGSSHGQRCFIRSDTPGVQRTITAAAISANDCDFLDINLAGAAAGTAPTRAGNCGGNTGITFPAPKTVYRVGTNTTWAGVNHWATSSGGSGLADNFPLPQDTAIVDNNTTGTSLTFGVYNFSSFNSSSRTTSYSINLNSSANYFGSLITGSTTSVSATAFQTITFCGRGAMTLAVSSTILSNIALDSFGGSLTLGGALTMSTSFAAFTVNRGTFDAAGYNVTCQSFTSSNTSTRTINMGSGTWTLGTGGWDTGTTNNLTFNKGTANILFSGTSGNRTFTSGGLSFYKLTIGGGTNTGSFTIVGAASFVELASTRTSAYSIILSNNLGTIDTWTVKGAAGALVTLVSNSVGTRRTFNLTNSTDSLVNYLAVRDIGVNQTNRFYVGANSVDNGNNLNVIFSTSPIVVATSNFMVMF